MRVVVISSQAQLDFEAIYQRTHAEFGPVVAKKLFNRFNRFSLMVSQFPFAYGFYFRSRSIRKFILTSSILVLYRVTKQRVEIITLVYASQDPVVVKRKIRQQR